jgi:hypothetical protein
MQLKECGLTISNWKWETFDGKGPYDSKATGQTLVGQLKCIPNLATVAGGAVSESKFKGNHLF